MIDGVPRDHIQDVVDAFEPTGTLRRPKLLESEDEQLPTNYHKVDLITVDADIDQAGFTVLLDIPEGNGRVQIEPLRRRR